MITSQQPATSRRLAAFDRTPMIVALAAAVGLLGLLWLMLGFGWTSDDIGNASTFLGLKSAAAGLLSPELWRLPHYNRFPLNTAYLYWTHTTLLAALWPAHALKWLLLVAMSVMLFRAIRREMPPTPTASVLPFLATAFVLTSSPLLITLADLSCTHYLLTFVFALAAVLLFPQAWGFVPSATALWLATFSSEIGVVMPVQILMLEKALHNAPLLSRRNALWLVLAWAPWLALKLLIWSQSGPKALVWSAYTLRAADAGTNVEKAFRALFVPDHALPGFVVGACMALLGGIALRRHLREHGAATRMNAEVNRSDRSAGPHNRASALLFGAALGLACLPFVLFARSTQSPRLYSEAVLILALWSPFVLSCAQRYRRYLLAAVGILLANQLVSFHHGTQGYLDSARSLDAFRHAYADSSLSRGRFEKSYVLRYRPPEFWPLGSDWGLPLLLQANALRTELLAWSALRPGQKVLVAFGSEPGICLPEGLSPREVEFSAFPAERPDSPRTQICDVRCDGIPCVRPVVQGE